MLEHPSFQCLISWGTALVKGNVDVVLSHYSKDAILWPTLSQTLRQHDGGMANYFDSFIKKVSGNVIWNDCFFQLINKDVCTWSGSYDFALVDGIYSARFTFVLVSSDELGWKILNHHSSLMPEE